MINLALLNIFIGSFLIFALSLRKRYWVVVLLLGWMVILSGLRNGCGYDYIAYRHMFESPELYYNVLEPGFLGIVHVVKCVASDYRVVFFCFSLLTVLFVYKGYSRMTNSLVLIPLVVYYLYPGLFYNGFSVVRQALALAIFVYAISFYQKGRLWYLLFWALIATTIHYSALFAVLVFLLACKIPIERRLALWLFFAFIFHFCMSILDSNISTSLACLGLKYAVYFDPDFLGSQSLVKVVGMGLLFFLLFVWHVSYSEDVLFLVRFLILGYLLFFVFYEYTPIVRFSYYSFAFIGVYIAWANMGKVVLPFYRARLALVVLIMFAAQLHAGYVEEASDTPNKIYSCRLFWN